jgi:hypothetical protein
MIWRSTVLILAAFLVAALAFWFAPALLDLVGLPEFGSSVSCVASFWRCHCWKRDFAGCLSGESHDPR